MIAMHVKNLRFSALRNAIYHSSRARFFARLNRWSNFLVVIFGASAVGDVGRSIGFSLVWFALIATITAGVQLVVDFSSKALKHEYLQRSFYEICAELVERPAPDEEFCNRIEGRLNRLYAEEPPPMRALDAISYNAACDSLGYGHGDRITVGFFQSLLRQWWPFEGTEFKWVKDGQPTELSAPT